MIRSQKTTQRMSNMDRTQHPSSIRSVAFLAGMPYRSSVIVKSKQGQNDRLVKAKG